MRTDQKTEFKIRIEIISFFREVTLPSGLGRANVLEPMKVSPVSKVFLKCLTWCYGTNPMKEIDYVFAKDLPAIAVHSD